MNFFQTAKHFHSTNHPLIKSFEANEEWGWCYIDELLFTRGNQARYARAWHGLARSSQVLNPSSPGQDPKCSLKPDSCGASRS